MTNKFPKNPLGQWTFLAGSGRGKSRWIDPIEAMRALDALSEVQGKPGLLVLDDLTGIAKGEETANTWESHMFELEKFFQVSRPVLPVHKRHAPNRSGSSDDLLPIIKAEIRRLRRPLAAVVDMQWEFCDQEQAQENKSPWFGLELIRLIKRAKPSLPIFVWSPIQDKHVLQRAMQLGASSCFDKPEGLEFNHDLPPGWVPDKDNLLDTGKLWFRILEWEFARYHCPPVGSSDGDFILATTPDARECRKKFLNSFKLTEADLIDKSGPPVERLLRALVPEAVGIEILRFFGDGQSRTERPFVVRGKTSNGRWLRPVQIKLSKDWRALAREGKGYRDVFAGCLGPSVAHVLTGPYRIDEWCGMSQSFAAPEEAIRDIATKSTRSLEDWLRKRLSDPEKCVQIVDEIFDGVLDPLYQGNLTKRAKSVFKAFDRVSPPHFKTVFEAPGDESVTIDFSPLTLSRKDARSRREMAYRKWKELADWWSSDEEPVSRTVKGLVVESLEIEEDNPSGSRLRLLDPTLGVKVDLEIGRATDLEIENHIESGQGKNPRLKTALATRWTSLANSPIKLVGLPVAFQITREPGSDAKDATKRKVLLDGWTSSIETLLKANGILEPKDDKENVPNRRAWELCRNYFHPWHPIDWSEEFHIGPTHGDLNLGNILLHEKGEGLFPWLIDFDKAEDNRPVVFDLAKLEIEAYHKIAQELFWELRHLDCVDTDLESRELLHRFEHALQLRRVSDVAHLWAKFEDGQNAVPESLKKRFEGLFSYLKQVHKRVEDLGIGEREFILGRAVYAMSCLKFKHLYGSNAHPNAPFPAKVILWKLEALLTALDESNGIQKEEKTCSVQEAAVRKAVRAVREARDAVSTNPLMEILSPVFSSQEFVKLKNLPDYKSDNGWTALLRLLRDKHLSGGNRWMRELLWYVRDFDLSTDPSHLAEFTKAMVLASQKTGTKLPTARTKGGVKYVDYASTGRPGNIFPSMRMLEHLAEQPDNPLIKISSRGESGGTIDILEKAGIPICRSEEAVNASLETHRWALVETSEALGEIDKILMKLRKECGCMKVDDLAMTSISAKKALLGISDFEVQVVTGYDAKFHSLLENDAQGTDIPKRWSDMWKAVYEKGEVTISFFDSGDLASWRGTADRSLIVFGQKLLAAKIWSDLGSGDAQEEFTQQKSLRSRLPAEFCNQMAELAEALGRIREAAAGKANENRELELSCREEDWILNLSRIVKPAHLERVRCEELKCVAEMKDFEDLSTILFSFGGTDAFAKLHVPYFDTLFSEISASGHPMASLLFGKNWMVVTRPRSDLPDDLQAWCWRILRDGFDETGSE